MKKVKEEENLPWNYNPWNTDIPEEGEAFKTKTAQEWNWMDFFNYFEAQYEEATGKTHWINFKQKGAKKGIIEQSFEYWGKDVFKAMIDWLFENYKDYPQWQDIHIGLVCGAHGWAKMIGEKAKQQIELDKKWKKA